MGNITLALAGNPNTGKTSLFNLLTGSRQHVGNWPGVTVERKEGHFSYEGMNFTLVDLPGIYSLGAASIDEQVASEFLIKEKPELAITVVDASNLERSLYLVVQMLEAGQPLIIALNMADVAENKGIRIHREKLEKALGVPVVPTVARERKGLEDLVKRVKDRFENGVSLSLLAIPYGEKVEQSLDRIAKNVSSALLREANIDRRLASIKIAEGDPLIISMLEKLGEAKEVTAIVEEENERLELELGYDLLTAVIERRWNFISAITQKVAERNLSLKKNLSPSDKIDRIVTHKIWGLPIFLIITWFMFRFTYAVGDPIADYLDGTISALGERIAFLMETAGFPLFAGSFVADGVIGGVGSIVVFFPHIMVLFAFIAILEDSGYMARGAFVMDRIMRAMGLHGKSFIPMLMGFGCNVPSIMATRVLERPRDRMITLLVLPFMSCSARLPVYLLFAGIFFGNHAGTIVFSLYVLGIAIAVISAKVLGSTLFKGESSQFVMELPPYHLPQAGSVLKSAWERASLFLKKAGTVIFGAVIIVWVMASLPLGVEYGSHESIIGRIGDMLAPLFAPAGFGFWQAGVALFFGFFAKEIVVGTLGTLLAGGEAGLASALPALFSPLSAYAFLVMTLLYVPCIAAVAAFKRETNSWKWTFFMIAYTTLIAYGAAVIVYQGGQLLLGLS